MLRFDGQLVDSWLKTKSESAVRQSLGLSPKQTKAVFNGCYDGFEEFLMWAALNSASDISVELGGLEERLGLSRVRVALFLGIPWKSYTRFRNGGLADVATANYVRIVANNPEIIKQLRVREI
jgi:hypothetical protein